MSTPDDSSRQLLIDMTMLKYKGAALLMVVGTIPLAVFLYLARPFAGTATSVDVSIVVSISVAVNVALVWALRKQVAANKEQNAHIQRLRGRIEQLETPEPDRRMGDGSAPSARQP